MTTITVDDECLRKVDRLQSLLKLQFDSISGEPITRGSTVEWAVNNVINTMTTTAQSFTATNGVSYSATDGTPLSMYVMAPNAAQVTTCFVGDPTATVTQTSSSAVIGREPRRKKRDGA